MSSYRRLSRTSRSNQSTNQYLPQNNEKDGSEDHSNNPFTYPPPPKHISFPDVQNDDSELANEFFTFAYTLIANIMQFLHLYRAIWWLPESYTNTAMNFYLIDTHLAAFIFTLLGRRFVYCLIVKSLENLCPQKYRETTLNITRYFEYFIDKVCFTSHKNVEGKVNFGDPQSFLNLPTRFLFVYRFVYCNIILIILGGCCLKIFQKQSYVVIFLCYPIVVYILTFGLEIEPFLRTTFTTADTPYLNNAPLHCCSTNPVAVRAEIDALKIDYNNRCKQVFFTAVLNAYYAAFIPCCFAQSFVFYDIYWATQHLAFLVLGGLTMCAMSCFSTNYCDVLHRASLHLGQWIRVENRSHAPPAVIWSKTVVWPTGSYVKHQNETFKSVGLMTTAIPANTVHYRFYLFFQNPANFYLTVSCIQSTLLMVQLLVLFFDADEWHNILSLSFLLLANYHTLFKSVRDYLVAHKIYNAESSVNDSNKVGGAGSNTSLTLISS